MKNKRIENYIGLTAILAFISYISAMIFSPLAYPGYDSLSMAVSDLSAIGAPSKPLWDQIASVYNVFEIISILFVAIEIQKKGFNTILKIGIYLFTGMSFISALGYSMFPFVKDNPNCFQNIMHVYVVTTLVVVSSIASFVLIAIGGLKKNGCNTIGILSIVGLSIMFIGSIGTGLAPKSIFGVFERFSTVSVVMYTMILGIWLFMDFYNNSSSKVAMN